MFLKDVLNDLKSDKVKNIILDTDAYNEVDDQYTIAYAMQSSERVNLMALCAAPFYNERSTSPGDGMLQSYHEIFKITKLVDPECKIPIYRGSDTILTSKKIPVESEAADKIGELVLGSDEPVYIVAIGAITNVASAIIKYPEIVKKSAVIWLGGHALHWPNTAEFNLRGDVLAAQVVFESGIPLLQIPCAGVCTEFLTSIPELEYYLGNKNALCDYLLNITRTYPKDTFGWSKVIWDVTAVAVFTKPQAFDMAIMPRPFITPDMKYAFDMANPHYIYGRRLRRDPIYADLFRKLAALK